MKYKDFEPSIIQEKRILKLCKRLNKFSLDEIETISEIDSEELKPIIDDLIQEERLTYCVGTYYYNKRVCKKQQISKLPLFFEFHKKQDIEYIIRGFCADVEVLKMIDLFGFTKHVMNKFYDYLRAVIYNEQYKELLKYFDKSPKLPQERVYMNTKVYLYLYNHKLYVSQKYLTNKEAKKHKEQERLEIKNIYLRSYRKVLNRSFTGKFHLHLAEEIWKYGKSFEERYLLLSKII